jgi:predicted GIY-YIG superfamily endonuclease
MADFLRVQLSDDGIGQALMTLVRMARAGDAEAAREAEKALKWLLTEWKLK